LIGGGGGAEFVDFLSRDHYFGLFLI
jgi:hypothetical protein